MKKVIGLVLGLVPVSATAECVPSPECSSIGYTETSCETGFLKCPFDASYMRCIPCDSSYRYSCNGDNIKKGSGGSCGGKYTACECISADYVFSNGKCTCDSSCAVGQIVYSDQSCSACLIDGKTPVALVIYNDGVKKIIAPIETPTMLWSADNVEMTEIENLAYADALTDMNGVKYTQIIVNHYGENTDTSSNAAVYCYNLNLYGFEMYKHKWYLPALGEIYEYFHTNRDLISKGYQTLGVSQPSYAWSSSEQNYFQVYAMRPDGQAYGVAKYRSAVTRCFLEI